jgi:hypothetical protein
MYFLIMAFAKAKRKKVRTIFKFVNYFTCASMLPIKITLASDHFAAFTASVCAQRFC